MRKLTVMLVDDNPMLLKTVHDLVAGLPHVARVDCANTGAEVLARIGTLQPDLVLTDIMMPEMSGFELIRALRALDNPPRVVAVTLHASPEYRAAALRSGAEDCISKRDLGTLIPEMIATMAEQANRSVQPV